MRWDLSPSPATHQPVFPGLRDIIIIIIINIIIVIIIIIIITIIIIIIIIISIITIMIDLFSSFNFFSLVVFPLVLFKHLYFHSLPGNNMYVPSGCIFVCVCMCVCNLWYYRKKDFFNFTAKEMNYLWSILDDYDIIIKKLIIDKAWWFRSNIILLASW